MKNLALFVKNLELLKRDNPLEAWRLEAIDCSRMKFCYTDENELNLVEEIPNKQIYLHSQLGAVWEATQWAKKLPLEDKDVLFVYGLGLGYYFLPLKKWLEENSKCHLVFLEDNLCVISQFLHTELATEILNHSQVMIKILPSLEPNQEGWAKLRAVAGPLFLSFAFSHPQMSALLSYFRERFEFFHAFCLQWLTGLSRANRTLMEFYPLESLKFHNFYANMMHLGETIPTFPLANAMKGLPAVLCGAGPSLMKQLPILRMLSEHAFLIGSGSAMNALTQAAIRPNVGGAIDPTSTQASRLLTSFGFEVPAFYQNYFFDQAFTQWHGPFLYTGGSGNYRVWDWFEKELGIEAAKIMTGVSTSNFLLEIANFIGCNPIVLAGMDLAYTDDKRYAKGVAVHPADDSQHHQELNQKSEVLMAVPGIVEKDVYTTNQWFYEAVLIGAFKERNPEIICLNATEGGMAIPSVASVPLCDASAKYFNEEWDIEGWFHGSIQNASSFKVSSEKVFEAMKKWKGSLENCAYYLDLLIGYFLKNTRFNSSDLYQGAAVLWLQELYLEPAYEFLLDTLNKTFETLNSLRLRKLKWCKDLKERVVKEISLELDRCRFLQGYVEDHLKSIEEGIKTFNERKIALSHIIQKNERLKTHIVFPDYRIKGKLSIQEPSLGVDVTAAFQPVLIPKDSWPKPHEKIQIEALIGRKGDKKEGQTLYFYPNGTIKAEAFYHSGKLHGPWSFYSPEGILLFRRWFVAGKKEGKCCAYYSTGSLYSICGYCSGLAQGKHLYYYPDGILKTEANYDKGLLESFIRLYYSNGLIKKEQHFANGQLHGQERVWNEWGVLIIEASYEWGRPVGISKKWNSHGELVLQIVHEEK